MSEIPSRKALKEIERNVKLAALEADNERMRSALLQLAHYSYHTNVARDIASRALDIPQRYNIFESGLKITVAVDDARPGYARIYQGAHLITEEHFGNCMHNRQLIHDHMSILGGQVMHEMSEHGAFQIQENTTFGGEDEK